MRTPRIYDTVKRRHGGGREIASVSSRHYAFVSISNSQKESRKKKRRRGVLDTSVLVAGIAGFKSVDAATKSPSAILLRDWIEGNIFTWLVTEEILSEYKSVLARLGVRRNVIGALINR